MVFFSSPMSAQSPKTVATLRWLALGGLTANVVTVVYPQKSDVRAALFAGAAWGTTWAYFESRNKKVAVALYVLMAVGNAWGAGYKIHARWDTTEPQF
jgi:hypothetical protein